MFMRNGLRPMRPLRCLAALLACALTIGAGTPVTSRSVSFDDLYPTYAGGDFDVVSREITRPGDCPDDLEIVKRVIQPWHDDWTRARAVFLLDVAITCRPLNRISLAPILSAAATYVIQRPTPVGPLSADVSFDVTWHLAALGLLQSQRREVPLNHNPSQTRIWLDPFLEELGYLDGLRKRFEEVHEPEVMDRFELARGIAYANRCCTQEMHARTVDLTPQATDGAAYADMIGTWKAQVAVALKSFDRARHVPETRREASVRGALLHLYRNEPDTALAWLQGVDDDPADVTLSYWLHAVRGRVLDTLQRADAAEREYDAALRLSPRAVAAAEWRAVDLMKLHRAPEAVALTVALANTADPEKDPWPGMDLGDFRLVTVWRDQLRAMMR
jgi:hypothetical protein